MPCPPSLEEQEANHCHYRLGEARQNARRLAQVQALLRSFLEGHRAMLSQIETIEAVLRASAEVNVGREPNWWNQPELVDQFWEWSKQIQAEDKRIEEDLCVASTALVCAWDELIEAQVDMQRYRERYLELEAHHRAHRKADKERVIQNLKCTLERYTYSSEAAERVRTQLIAVKGYGLEALMRDRSLLDVDYF